MSSAPAPSTREAILYAAAREFARVGYKTATVQAIAAAAGFTPPTVYSHFGSKQGLLEALVKELMDDLWSILDRELPAGLSLAQWLELRVRELLAMAARRRDLFTLFILRPYALPMMEEHEDADEKLEAYWRNEFGRFQDELGDRTPREAALVMDGVIYAFVKSWVRTDEPSLEPQTRRIVQLILEGIGT